MAKRTQPTTWEPEIDQEYEQRVTALSAVDGHVSDYAGQYAIEPVRQQPPATWTPGKTAVERHQEQRSATIGHLRQMVDQQAQEGPTMAPGGNKFIITDDSNARTRASAGIAWWLVSTVSLLPLGLGLAVWTMVGWGFIAFFLTFVGAGMLMGAVLLNWQSIAQSPIAVEKKQRSLDHEYRMFREENAQRTREMIAGAFLGNARQDLAANAPVVDGQILLTDNRNGVRK